MTRIDTHATAAVVFHHRNLIMAERVMAWLAAGFIFGTEPPEICRMPHRNAKLCKNPLAPNRLEEIPSQFVSVWRGEALARFSPAKDVVALLRLFISHQTTKVRLSDVQ